MTTLADELRDANKMAQLECGCGCVSCGGRLGPRGCRKGALLLRMGYVVRTYRDSSNTERVEAIERAPACVDAPNVEITTAWDKP